MMNKQIVSLLGVVLLIFAGCTIGIKSTDDVVVNTESDSPQEIISKDTKEPFVFRDVFGEEYETVINENIKKNPYDKELFAHDGHKLSYSEEGYSYMLGVDVSHHQGNIDWARVKDQGYEFAILRIAYRGYGKTGSLNPDTEFTKNIVEAQAVGLKVGVYIFSQAINEAEAVEEAEYVLKLLDGHTLELPVVYDPESILDDEARTDNVSSEQFTKNTKVFCETIKQSGFTPMIYANMLWEAFELDLEELEEYPVWYADYEAVPQTPYFFEMWQYTNEGQVSGIPGNVDLNILIKGKDNRF